MSRAAGTTLLIGAAAVAVVGTGGTALLAAGASAGFVTTLGALGVATAAGATYYQRREEAIAAGTDAGGLVNGRAALAAAGDLAFGLSGFYEGITGTSVVTGQELDQQERSQRFGNALGGALTELAAGGLAARAVRRSTGVADEVAGVLGGATDEVAESLPRQLELDLGVPSRPVDGVTDSFPRQLELDLGVPSRPVDGSVSIQNLPGDEVSADFRQLELDLDGADFRQLELDLEGVSRGAENTPSSGALGAFDDANMPVGPFVPGSPVHMSPAHTVNTITPKVRFGAGNRNTLKTVARGDIDIAADIAEINSGRATLLKNGNILTSSGRIYGTHPGQSSVFLRSGSPGTVDLTQAEFRVLQNMIKSGGLQGNALKMLEGLSSSNNPGITSSSKQKLVDLFNSRRN